MASQKVIDQPQPKGIGRGGGAGLGDDRPSYAVTTCFDVIQLYPSTNQTGQVLTFLSYLHAFLPTLPAYVPTYLHVPTCRLT
jgi:hypothetical protein